MSPRSSHDSSPCGPGCRYRSLYEGTLASLADLNDKLREAIGRHGRLRNNLVSVMKKAFPQQFLRAERIEQRRMADQSDEVLIRYLTLWLSERPGSGLERVPGLEDLRGVLNTGGFLLPPDNDLTGWARAISEQQERRRDEAVTVPRTGAEVVNLFDPRTQPKVVDPPEPVGPGPVTPSHPSADDELLALFDELDATPARPAVEPPPAPRSERVPPLTPAPGPPPKPSQVRRESPKPKASKPEAGQRHPDPVPTPTTPDTAGAPTPEHTTTRPVATTDAAPLPAPPRAAQGPAMRPQLFPQQTTRKTRRRRAGSVGSAASPGPELDVPQASGDGTPVPDDVGARALEVIKRPSPVFTSDLVALGVGTEAQVSAWEQACRDGQTDEVRFIPAKPRHLDRGALVLPFSYEKKAPAEFKRSVWAQALRLWRGGRLYEMAVLLHRVEGDLIAADLDAEHAVLRLSQPRGAVAVVAVLGTELDRGGEDRARLVETMERLLSTPLTLIAVTVTNHHSLADLVAAMTEEARERDWQPPCPVIVQRSWEYAADRGTSAQLVLGG
jgi:hypothetical protein